MNEWLTGIGPAVANHLWQSTAFAVVVWGLTLGLRRNQARVRFGLWLAASVKFLLPFSLLIALGGMLPRPQRAVVTMPVYSAVDEVALPFVADDAAVARTQVSEARPGSPELSTMLAGVWLCGVGMVMGVWAVRWRRVWAAVRTARLVESGREVELLRRVEAAMGVRRAVPLRLSGELMEPGIFGILRPVMLWPERLSERLDDEHIDAILAHELMHVRRRDNGWAALHMVVEAAFWFHPLVWWMERRMVEERERACDEAVVAMGGQPEVYAESLLKAVRFCVESPLACVAGITGADLSRRVGSIMSVNALRRLTWGKKALLAAMALVTVAAPILLGQASGARRMIVATIQAAPMTADSIAPAAGKQAGSAASAPELIYSVEPEFTEQARKAKASGDVLVSLWVNEHGNPRQVLALRRLGMGLDGKAEEAVKQYRYRPAMEDGKPVASHLTVVVKFRVF